MSWKRIGDHVVIVLPRGASVGDGIRDAAEEAGVASGSFTGIGAAENIRLAWFDRYEKCYREHALEGVWEIVALIGNVTRFEGAPRIHCHAVVSDRGCSTRAGHLVEASVAVTCEVSLMPYAEPLERAMDPAFKLPLIDLSKS